MVFFYSSQMIEQVKDVQTGVTTLQIAVDLQL